MSDLNAPFNAVPVLPVAHGTSGVQSGPEPLLLLIIQLDMVMQAVSMVRGWGFSPPPPPRVPTPPPPLLPPPLGGFFVFVFVPVVVLSLKLRV